MKQRSEAQVDRKKKQELDRERQHQAKRDRLERDRKAQEARLERERQALAAIKRRLATAVARGDYRTAAAVQAALVNANKDDPKLWQDFATYLEKSGQLDKAATAIRQAALLAGTDAAPLVSAMYRRDAVAHAANGDWRKAIAQQAMAIEASKNNADLWLGLAGYMEKDGQLENAAVAYRRAHMLGAPNPEDKIFAMHFEHTWTKARSADAGRRIEIYRVLVAKFPDARSNSARHRLAEELLKQQRTGEAHDVLRRIADLDPSDKAARARLAAIQGGDQASSVSLTEQSDGKRGQGKVVSETASAPGNGTSNTAPSRQVSERHPAEMKQLTELITTGINALALRQQWGVEKRARLAQALKDLGFDGADADGHQIRFAWATALNRTSDSELKRKAMQGQGPGLPGASAGKQSFDDCTIFALANATGQPYSLVAAHAAEMIRNAEWRSTAERTDPQKVIKSGLNGGEVILLTEAFGRAEIVPSSAFEKTLKEGRPIMATVEPSSGKLGNSHQVVLIKTFQHNNDTWFEVVDSNQGPLRRLYMLKMELDIILQYKGVAYSHESGTKPMLLR